MKKLPPPSRREVLGGLGAGGLALGSTSQILAHLATVMVEGMIAEAKAAESGGDPPKNLVYFPIIGGASGYCGPAPLKISPDVPFIPPAAFTAFNANGTGNYEAVPITVGGRTVYLPPLFATNIPSGTGTEPMANLAANMLFLRSIIMINSHPEALKLMQTGRRGYSLLGTIADADVASNDPSYMGAVSVAMNNPSTYNYRAKNAPLTVCYSASLNYLMEPYKAGDLSATFKNRREAVRDLAEYVQNALSERARTNLPGATRLQTTRKMAQKLFTLAAENLTQVYSEKIAKYEALIRRCTGYASVGDTGVPGVYGENVVVPNVGGLAVRYKKTSLADGTVVNDLVDIPNLARMIEVDSTVVSVAQDFAFAEYVLENGLSRVLSMQIGDCDKLRLTSALKLGLTADAHDIGSHVQTVMDTFKFRAIYACVNELKRVCITKGIWNNTLVVLGTEFGRNFSADLGSSEHGWQQGWCNVMGGSLDPLNVVGNLKEGQANGTFIGTWEGGTFADGSIFDPAKLVNTISHLAGSGAVVPGVRPVTDAKGNPLEPPKTWES